MKPGNRQQLLQGANSCWNNIQKDKGRIFAYLCCAVNLFLSKRFFVGAVELMGVGD